MTPEEKVHRFRSITDRMVELYENKNFLYGDSFARTYKKYGPVAAMVRMSDKMNRLDAMYNAPQADDLGESIMDTLTDLANYAVMTMIAIEENGEG